MSYALNVDEQMCYEEPKSYKEAINGEEMDEWLLALLQEELD